MKIATTTLCSAVLGCAAVLSDMPAHATVTDSDKTFLATAAQSDMNEIGLSQLAETKASSPAVKKFAEKMVTDHNKLEANMKPYADKWGITPPSGPDADHQAELTKLQGLSGADFDKEYMTQMDKDHHMALDSFNTEVSTTTEPKFKSTVMKGQKVVAEHTKMADDLQQKMS